MSCRAVISKTGTSTVQRAPSRIRNSASDAPMNAKKDYTKYTSEANLWWHGTSLDSTMGTRYKQTTFSNSWLPNSDRKQLRSPGELARAFLVQRASGRIRAPDTLNPFHRGLRSSPSPVLHRFRLPACRPNTLQASRPNLPKDDSP